HHPHNSMRPRISDHL
uniref:Uncharacterized protein n=1 Tax=Amphimedon queenslandica TaxID=400682 RepID=A0A1X7V6E8_AMPQE